MTIEVENPLDWNVVRKAIQAGYQDPEFVKLFGRFNDPFPNMRIVEASKFWGRFRVYGMGVYNSTRQILNWGGNRYLSVHYFIYHDGTGFAISVDWRNGEQPTFYSFAICEHQRVSTLDTIYGWHEGYCKKCGMGMNYDSGD